MTSLCTQDKCLEVQMKANGKLALSLSLVFFLLFRCSQVCNASKTEIVFTLILRLPCGSSRSGNLICTLWSLVICWMREPLGPMMERWNFWAITHSMVTWASWERRCSSGRKKRRHNGYISETKKRREIKTTKQKNLLTKSSTISSMRFLAASTHSLAPLRVTFSLWEPVRGKLTITPPYSSARSRRTWPRRATK